MTEQEWLDRMAVIEEDLRVTKETLARVSDWIEGNDEAVNDKALNDALEWGADL